MERVDFLIIGAGVIGLAVAAELALKHRGRSLIVLERREKFGQETSSRNSEVIHAGIYYPPGTLKASLCVEGNQMLYRFCKEWSIPHRRIGKLIVGVSLEEIPTLETLLKRGIQNGLEDLQLLDRSQIAKMEPHIKALKAIFSPSTGIVDTHKLMARLEHLAIQRGALIAYCHRVTNIEHMGNYDYRVYFNNPDGSKDSLRCSWVINCAGLEADRVASWIGLDLEENNYKIFPCKGEYFSVTNEKAKLISHLIYPSPLEELKGLGIHVTKTLDNRVRLGPNAIYIYGEDRYDYRVDPGHIGQFYEAVKKFLPFLEYGDLTPEMAGIRPKLQGPGDPFRDFVISHEEKKGFKGVINLIGIESPGLTCSLAIARHVSRLVQ